VLLGAADGTFTEAPGSAVPRPASILAEADLNKDGAVDLVTMSPADREALVLRGVGDGTFEEAEILDAPSVSTFALRDISGDSNPDLIFTSNAPSGGRRLLVRLGRGDATFDPVVSVDTECVDESDGKCGGSSIAVADVNRDGEQDLILAGGFFSSDFQVLLGVGDGTTFHHPARSYRAYPSSFAIDVGDFNGDGALDLVGTIFGKGPFVMVGKGDGTFGPPVEIDLPSPSDYPFRQNSPIKVADLNEDGVADLVATGSYLFQCSSDTDEICSASVGFVFLAEPVFSH
jgi:hypothetical protein